MPISAIHNYKALSFREEASLLATINVIAAASLLATINVIAAASLLALAQMWQAPGEALFVSGFATFSILSTIPEQDFKSIVFTNTALKILLLWLTTHTLVLLIPTLIGIENILLIISGFLIGGIGTLSLYGLIELTGPTCQSCLDYFSSWRNRTPIPDTSGNQYRYPAESRTPSSSAQIYTSSQFIPPTSSSNAQVTPLTPSATKEWLERWYNTAEITDATLPFCNNELGEYESNSLNNWLSRLHEVKEFDDGDLEQKKAFANTIVKYIEKANTDDQYRQCFFTGIDDATSTCGDRVAYSLVYLESDYQLHQCPSGDLTRLIQLFKGKYALTALEAFGKEYALKRDSDEGLEYCLVLILRLKETLNLPVEINDMLYRFTVPDREVHNAASVVLEALENPLFYSFLIEEPIWDTLLQKTFSQELEKYHASCAEINSYSIEAYNSLKIKLSKQLIEQSNNNTNT